LKQKVTIRRDTPWLSLNWITYLDDFEVVFKMVLDEDREAGRSFDEKPRAEKFRGSFS
jgi:hypothetical protein